MLVAIFCTILFEPKSLLEVAKAKDAVLFANSQATVGSYLRAEEALWFCERGDCQLVEKAFGPGHIGFQTGQHFVSYRYRDPENGSPESVRQMRIWRGHQLQYTVEAAFPHLPASAAFYDGSLAVFSLEKDLLQVKRYSLKGALLSEIEVPAPVSFDRYTRGRVVTHVDQRGLFVWIPQSGFLLEMNGDLEVKQVIELAFPERLAQVDNTLFRQFIEQVDQKGEGARERFLQVHNNKVFRYEPINLLAGDDGTWQIIYQVLMVEPEREAMQFMSINSLVVEYRDGVIVDERLWRHKNLLGFFEKALVYQEEDRTFAFK